jgi:bifunctional non-homologous end joining protein LigD
MPIAGFALKENKFDGIFVGRLEGSDLIYAGKVDNGFDKASAAELQARLKPLIRRNQPYAKKIAHHGVWVQPSGSIEIPSRSVPRRS